MHIPNPTKLRFGSNDSRINRTVNINSNSNSHSKERDRGKSMCDDNKELANKSFENSNTKASVNATFILNNSYITTNNNYSFDVYTTKRANNKNLNLIPNNPKKKVI